MEFKSRPLEVLSNKEIILALSLNQENTLEVSLSQIQDNAKYDRDIQRDNLTCDCGRGG